MDHIVDRIETVDNKGVTHRHVLAAVKHGASGTDLILYDLVELGLGACLRALSE